MKTSTRYEIDFTKSKIIVTKSFLKEAGTIGNKAYNELAQVRRDFPEFTIVQREITKKPGKKSYGKLNYKVMADFIKEYEEANAPMVLNEFERMQKLSKAQAGKYAYVKTWFLNRYKDVFTQKDETAEAKA